MKYNNYFLSLEDKFVEISKYVEVVPVNYLTYSTEIALIYMAACSEFEVVAKEICKVLQPGFKANKSKINNIADVITVGAADMINEEVDLAMYSLSVKPLENWSRGSALDWWRSYNKVKHNRGAKYPDANLENLIDAMAALSIVNYYYVWKSECPTKKRTAPPVHMKRYPRVFRLSGISYEGPYFTDDMFDL